MMHTLHTRAGSAGFCGLSRFQALQVWLRGVARFYSDLPSLPV